MESTQESISGAGEQPSLSTFGERQQGRTGGWMSMEDRRANVG